MPKIPKFCLPLALTAGFLVALAGCAPETADIAQNDIPGEAPEVTIRFGYIAADQLHSPAVMVMKEKKLLEAAGFSVEWHEYTAGAHATQDMASGVIDFANCGVAPIVISRSLGVDLTIIAGSNREGTGLVVRDSIKSVADLDGKTIATPGLGSIQDAMLTRLAMENGISINRTTMDVSDMQGFLQKGEIDGFIAWEPHPSNAANQKLGYELLTSRDMMPDHQCCVLVTKEALLQNDRETVQKVLEVYLDAYEWFLENPEESVRMIVKATGVSEPVIREAMTTVSYGYPPFCNVESMESVARGLVDAGRIPAMGESEMERFLTGMYQPGLMEETTGAGNPG